MATLTFHPGVCSTVLHPITLVGPPVVIPAGTTYVKAARAAYTAVRARSRRGQHICGRDQGSPTRPSRHRTARRS